MSKTSTKIKARLKSLWRHHKVLSLIIAYLFGMLVVLPVIGTLAEFITDGTEPVPALEYLNLIGSWIGVVITLAISGFFHFRSSSGRGSPKGNVLEGNALSNLVNRRSVHPQSDYRAQERAAQDARIAAAQGFEALKALERAGGDPTTMQQLQREIDRAESDAKTFQEWADD